MTARLTQLDPERREHILPYQTAPLERPPGYAPEARFGEVAWVVITGVAGAVWLAILFPMLRMLVFR